MAKMETKSDAEQQAMDGLILWATSGLPSTLADSVCCALKSIATSGACRGASDEWIMFGEVVESTTGPPLRVDMRRTSMLLDPVADHEDWATFQFICPDVHERVDFSAGMWVGALVQPHQRLANCQVYADQAMPLWNVSHHDKHLAWNVSHLFAGAYEGWLRSMWWLQQANLGHVFATHTSVDWCPKVMKTWSFNHGRDHLKSPITAAFNSTEVFTGILADISDQSLLRATSHKLNLIMTLSPPCPSWSRGGKHSGLASDEGFCFLDSIEHVARVRPILALFECSDGLEAHPHWRALSAALQLAGYRKIWSQDLAVHQLTSNHRTRWLSAWGRKDIDLHPSRETLLCAANRRLPWNDCKHLFALPKTLQEALRLTPDQQAIYGNRDMLPPAKRARVVEGVDDVQVLAQRVAHGGEYLPTLCASYPAQHLLNKEHIQTKGIFATLTQKEDQFCFIDPFVFVALFGTTDSIALPVDPKLAFHQLGNAISQIHGLVALLFGLEGIEGGTIDKMQLVMQCWEDRLTVDSAMIRVCDDMLVLQPFADFIAKAIPCIATWQPWLIDHTLVRFSSDASLIPLNVSAEMRAVDKLLAALDLADHHAGLVNLIRDGTPLPVDSAWADLPAGDISVKLGGFVLCSLQVVHTDRQLVEIDPIVSPTQPWCPDEEDPVLDNLRDLHRAGFFHVAEYVCQDDEPRQKAKILLVQQDGTFEWIQDANLDRLGSIPMFQHQEQMLHFFKVNHDACRALLGVHVVMAIQGSYQPVSSSKWVLLAGGHDLKWCKICQVPRTVTPQQCDEFLEQQCHVTMRNLVECRQDQPLMLINGDLLWCDTRVRDVVPILFGGMDQLTEYPSCNVQNDDVVARLLQFNMEPGALAMDEILFHFDILQVLMPSICWCPPGLWVNNESQFRFPHEPADLLLAFQHFVVPILVVFDWIFVEVRFFEGQWRVLYHSPEQLTIRQMNAVLELINVMGVRVLPNAFRWIRATEDSELYAWHTLRTFYARAGAPLLPVTHRSVQRLQRTQFTEHVMQVIDQADFVWREIRTDDRMLQFARASRNAFLVAIMDSPSRAADLVLRATGRALHTYDLREVFFVADDWLEQRANICRTHPGWTTSDEIEFALAFFLPNSFCPPVLHHDLSLIASGVKANCLEVQRFVALREGHWVGIEVVCNVQEHTCRAVFLQVPPRDQQFWHDFAIDYVVPMGFRPIIIIDTNRTRPGMCGWELLHRWIIVDLALPDDFHIPQQKRQLIDLILDESDQAWRTAGAPPMLRTFAANLRRLFLLVGGVSYLQPCSAVSLGGMEGAASAESPMQVVDPWQIDDPWKSKKKQVKQSKWEDLQLQADHPFVGKDKTPVPFVQKQQLSTNRGGIAFVSKGNLQSAKEVQPKESCALLLPLIDPTDPLAKLQNMSGPFEVIVFDPALNHEYKRQVHLLVITPEVNFVLPTPAITLTLAAVCEIVLECDARLTSKDVFHAFYDNPLAKFKIHLKEAYSDPIWNHAAIYGYRVIQEHTKDKHDVVHQCLLKIQEKHRIPLLAASGNGELIVRDFIPKGEQIEDLSIIPRFWPIDRANKADLIKAASSITGYRGIAVTKRGLAPRFATDALATARDLLLPQDDRICTINKAMVPKVNMDSLGWPSEILAKDIVSAVHQATKTPCIPTRSFRRAGVCAWTLSFEKPPSVSKFSVQVNGKTFEVLLTPATYKNPGKGKGKGKGQKGSAPANENLPPRGVVSKENPF